ncbi:MAG: exodeoxyribonuclease VII small subunit [Cellulomonadaceae bacterium]|jgi:exodeoxyribonuclease VII small subunit|nr:exodeoxyribonuclease VII small subunit [Cellulomonadaceae bacterium]
MPPHNPTPTSATPTVSDALPANLPDPSSLGYEKARDGLEWTVKQLEAGSESLESSLALWEYGEALAARCADWLGAARQKFDAATAATPATIMQEEDA